MLDRHPVALAQGMPRRTSPSTAARPESADGEQAADRAGWNQKPQRFRRLLRRRTVRVILALVAVFSLVGVSVGQALAAPGGGSTSSKLAEWARDHYLGPVVTFGEWLTSYSPPKVGGKPSSPSPCRPTRRPAEVQGRSADSSRHPGAAELACRPAAAGRGPVAGARDGQRRAAMFGTFLRPDRRCTPPTWPGSSRWTSGWSASSCSQAPKTRPGQLESRGLDPPGSRTGLLATFNGGFKLDSAGGGFYLNGVDQGNSDQRGGVGRLLPQRHDQDRRLGQRGADDPERGRRPAEPQADRRPRPGPGRGEQERDRGPGAPPSAAGTTCGARASASPRRPGHLRVRPGAQRPGARQPAPAGGRGARPCSWTSTRTGCRYEYYQAEGHPSDPAPGTCCPPSSGPRTGTTRSTAAISPRSTPVTAEASATEVHRPAGRRKRPARS